MGVARGFAIAGLPQDQPVVETVVKDTSDVKPKVKGEAIKPNWTILPASKPVLDGDKLKEVKKDTLYVATIKHEETRIGHSEAPKARISLKINTTATHKIFRDYTDIHYDVIVECSGYAVGTGNAKPILLTVDIGGKEHEIQLGGVMPNTDNVYKFSKNETIIGNDIILHRQPINNIDKLRKIESFEGLQRFMSNYYPTVNNLRSKTGGAREPYLIYPYPVSSNSFNVRRFSLMASAFGGAGSRMVRVNRAEYAEDKPIKDRNKAEYAIASWGVNWGLGLNIKKSHTIAAEAFFLKEGFRSNAAVDWASGKMSAGQGAYLDTEYRGAGLSYYYLPNKFLLQVGLFYTRLHDATEFGEHVNDEAWIGKLAIGYSKRWGGCNVFAGPAINYNFTAFNKQELMTRLFSVGLTAGVRLVGNKE